MFFNNFIFDFDLKSEKKKMIYEALRYMKVPPDSFYLDDKNDEIIETVIEAYEKLKKIITPRRIWGKFNLVHFDGGFKAAGTDFYSRDLQRLTSRSDECYLIAATLGPETDRQISLAQKQDMLKGLALDACASVLIDTYCDQFINSEIKTTLHDEEFLTSRFSPGYGDAPLKLTEDILEILNAHKRIGLSVTSSLMMIPVKSITAIIGVAKK